MSAAPTFVDLLGKKHAVVLPDYAAREEVMVAYGESRNKKGVALMRVYSAALGLSTRLGRMAGADYAACRFDVLAYGGAVYSYLREQGVTMEQLSSAAIPLVIQISEATFPRKEEIDEAAGNSGGVAAS
jgi:hypothetical protein